MTKLTLKKHLDSINQDLAYNLSKFRVAQTYEAAENVRVAVRYAFFNGLWVCVRLKGQKSLETFKTFEQAKKTHLQITAAAEVFAVLPDETNLVKKSSQRIF